MMELEEGGMFDEETLPDWMRSMRGVAHRGSIPPPGQPFPPQSNGGLPGIGQLPPGLPGIAPPPHEMGGMQPMPPMEGIHPPFGLAGPLGLLGPPPGTPVGSAPGGQDQGPLDLEEQEVREFEDRRERGSDRDRDRDVGDEVSMAVGGAGCSIKKCKNKSHSLQIYY